MNYKLSFLKHLIHLGRSLHMPVSVIHIHSWKKGCYTLGSFLAIINILSVFEV